MRIFDRLLVSNHFKLVSKMESCFVDAHDLMVAFRGKKSASWARKLYRTIKDAYGVKFLTVKMVANYMGVSPEDVVNNCKL